MSQDTVLNFDFSQIDPSWSGGGFLPVSDDKGWLVVLVGSNGFKQAQSGEGYYLELVGKGQDQAVANQEFYIRLNLQHTKPNAVQAAYAQLSALGHVCGLGGRIGNASELFNKPFRVVSEKQKNGDYTQLANNGIRDVNGNPPGKAGSGPQMATPAPQIPQQGQGGFPQQQGQGGGFGGQAPQGQGQPQQFGQAGAPGNFTVPQQFTGTGQPQQAFDPGGGQPVQNFGGPGQPSQPQGQPAFGQGNQQSAFGQGQGQGQPAFGGGGQPQPFGGGQGQGGAPSWSR